MPAALCYVHTGNRKERVERLPGRYEINYIRQIFAKRLNKKFLLLSTVLPVAHSPHIIHLYRTRRIGVRDTNIIYTILNAAGGTTQTRSMMIAG